MRAGAVGRLARCTGFTATPFAAARYGSSEQPSPPSPRSTGAASSQDRSTPRPASSSSTPSPSPPSDKQSTSPNSLLLDDTYEWIQPFIDRSLGCGRLSPDSADYIRNILYDEGDFRECLQEARRLIGGQAPEKLTHYQQGQFADRLCHYMSGIASEKLRRAHAEEQSTKQYTKDGTPTGDNYWFEAGNTLASPSIPAFVKDSIMDDMQRDRSPKSPAFQPAPEEAQLAAEDEGYATHLRRQRSKLLGGVDFK